MACARSCGACVECLSPLPAGRTCADCRHVRRCTMIFGQDASERACQFIPSRWHEAPRPEAEQPAPV